MPEHLAIKESVASKGLSYCTKGQAARTARQRTPGPESAHRVTSHNTKWKCTKVRYRGSGVRVSICPWSWPGHPRAGAKVLSPGGSGGGRGHERMVMRGRAGHFGKVCRLISTTKSIEDQFRRRWMPLSCKVPCEYLILLSLTIRGISFPIGRGEDGYLEDLLG